MTAYDDLPLDREFVSPARAVSDADVKAFAELTGDRFPLHLDEAFASRSIYGRRIAHGMLVLSCSVGLAIEMNIINDALLAFYGIDRLRFTRPVFIGDTIAVKKRVVEKRPLDEARAVVAFDTKVVNQSGDVVLAYVDRYLLAR